MELSANIGIITGTGLYDLKLDKLENVTVQTEFGDANVDTGIMSDKKIAHIARHGKNHEKLPNVINYRANLFAMKKLGVSTILSTSIMGIANPNIELGHPLVMDDIFFVDNRLPSGELCTVFVEGRERKGHYIFQKPFSTSLKEDVIESIKELNMDYFVGCYGHVNGPRFNSKTEVTHLKELGVSAISQTAGPEVILAGELEIPMQLIGFGVDYANGIGVTPKEELAHNIALSSEVLENILIETVKRLAYDKLSKDDAFIYWI
jgi:purine nucleoside phosphorylase